MEAYTETTGALGRAAETDGATVAKYAKAGLLDYVMSSDGRMLFQPSTAARVRELKAAGLARRGRPRERQDAAA